MALNHPIDLPNNNKGVNGVGLRTERLALICNPTRPGYRVLAALSFGVAVGLAAHGGVYVATNATPAAPHDTWANAYTNVQDALDAAAASAGAIDTIYLAGHTFDLINQIEWTTAGLTLIGGHAATNVADQPGPSDPAQWPTVLARSGGGDHRILHIDGADNSTLQQVTVTGGREQDGSGLLINDSHNVILSGCIIAENQRRQSLSGLVAGGGIYARSSVVTLTNCVVRGNRVDNNRGPSGGLAYGGGIWSDGALTIRDSRIQNNDAWTSSNQDRPAGGRGGGLYFAGTNLNMKNVLFTDNDASGSGHGIYIASGTVNLDNLTVTYQPGEGIRRVGGTVTVTNSIVWGNWIDIVGSVNVSFSNIGDTEYGGDNISADPLFEYGFYLADGSPCLGAGSDTAENLGMQGYVRNLQGDSYGSGDTVNLGYHYPAGFDLRYADLYVATDGDDEINSGQDAGSPLQTLTKALSLAREGSCIHVAPGLYSEATNGETFPLTVTDTPGLQILGTDAGNTILDAGNAGPRVLTLMRAHQAVIENVTVTGGTTVDGAGIRIDRSQRVTMTGCVITGNAFTTGLGGTYRGGGAFFSLSDVTLIDCLFSHNSVHNTRGGTPYGNTRGGGLWSDGFLTLHHCRFQGNTASITRSGDAQGDGGAVAFSGRSLEMRNNLLFDNTGTRGDGLHIGRVWDDRGLNVSPDLVAIVNATFADNQGEGIRRADGTVSILNGIAWGNGDDLVGVIEAAYSLYGVGADIIDGGNNISDNPLFVDPAAGDYRLKRGSPAIDAGLNQTWMPGAVDLDGRPRILMGTVDMGCYEALPPPGTLILFH